MGLSCKRARSLDMAGFAVDPHSAEFDEFRAHYPTCPDCAQEVERLSRLESTLRSQSRQGEHPDAQALLALERRPEALPSARREQLSAHLEGCPPCRAELRALRRFEVEGRARGWLGRAAAPARQAAAPVRRAPPPRRRKRPVLLVAALAAGLLIVVALPLYLQRGTGPGEPVAVAPEPAPVMPSVPEAVERPETRVAEERAEQPEAAPAPGEPEAVRVAREQPEPTPVPDTDAPQQPEPLEIAMVFPSDPLVYAPPGNADPLLQRWRVPGVVRSGGGSSIRIQALAPDHIGLTAEPAPTLYWTLSGPTDLRVEIVVTDETSEEPLVDHAVEGAGAGIHALRLADLGVVLEPGVLYRWYATVVPDPEDRSSEVVSAGAIERIVPDAALQARLAEAGPGRRAHVLAAAGLFYDTLDVLSSWIADYPDAGEPRRDRAALLNAVGLGKALPSEGGRAGSG